MSTYYLKKLANQELGSVTEDNPNPHRGRYIYISKKVNEIGFFPYLTRTELNDSAMLPIIMLYSNIENPKKVYSNYTYHNDTYHSTNGTRNEFRLYLNTELDLNRYYFRDGDIVIFKKVLIEVNGGPDQEIETQEVYFLDCVKPEDGEYYEELNTIINSSNINGGHALYDFVLPRFEKKLITITENIQNIDVVIDNTLPQTINTLNTEQNVSRLFNPQSFRDFVLNGYEEKCAITGEVIRHGNLMNIEAAHIQPRSREGLYLPSNGIALSRDMHWAFDKGFITIDNSYKVIVHDDIQSEALRRFHNQEIFLPETDFFKPDLNFLRYHKDNIFGLFLASGRI